MRKGATIANQNMWRNYWVVLGYHGWFGSTTVASKSLERIHESHFEAHFCELEEIMNNDSRLRRLEEGKCPCLQKWGRWGGGAE